MGRRALYDCVYAQVVPYEEQRPRGGQARYRFPKREIDALVAAGGLTAEQRSSARRVSLDLSRARSGTTPETAAARARRIERDAVMLPSIVA